MLTFPISITHQSPCSHLNLLICFTFRKYRDATIYTPYTPFAHPIYTPKHPHLPNNITYIIRFLVAFLPRKIKNFFYHLIPPDPTHELLCFQYAFMKMASLGEVSCNDEVTFALITLFFFYAAVIDVTASFNRLSQTSITSPL